MRLEALARDLALLALAGASDALSRLDVRTATASDLMSDVLALTAPCDLLVTNLANSQVVRTCAIYGIPAVVIAHGHQPENGLVEAAREEEIAVFSTPLDVLDVCGRLYAAGVRSVK